MVETSNAIWTEHDQRIRPYVWGHRALSISRSLISLFIAVYFIFTPLGRNLETALSLSIQQPFLLWLAYFGIVALLWKIYTFPLDIGHYVIDKKFGLSKQSFRSWLWDGLKAGLLGAAFAVIAFGILYLSIRFFPQVWWIPCCTLLMVFSILLAQLAPVLLIPLFFKLKPMEPGALKDRLIELSKQFGVHVADVYHLGLGEKTEKGNAAFVGLGRTKRIMIGDTLYQKFSPEEVEAVFAHELGHQVHNDLWRGIAVGAVFLFISFFLAQWIASQYLLPTFQAQIDRPFGLFIFFVVLSFVQTPMGTVQTIFSRFLENQADAFAAQKTHFGQILASALEKLTLQNYGFFKPHPLIEFFTYSHPAPWRRIAKLRGEAKAY